MLGGFHNNKFDCINNAIDNIINTVKKEIPQKSKKINKFYYINDELRIVVEDNVVVTVTYICLEIKQETCKAMHENIAYDIPVKVPYLRGPIIPFI